MSDQFRDTSGDLVTAGRRELASAGAANPLVSRGLADLAKLQSFDPASLPPPLRRLYEIGRRMGRRKRQIELGMPANQIPTTSTMNSAPISIPPSLEEPPG